MQNIQKNIKFDFFSMIGLKVSSKLAEKLLRRTNTKLFQFRELTVPTQLIFMTS